ncbi:single-stranded-DNA-specific exonuclease RecJ [Pseudalkalibacillus caeni]|uniref:Single-stranded-DNA-specific exonuclease RecJ n=1 Tax=Exobacillus caeni TaxID=2574798 RepID=A0A5R9F6R2_9BACL|nr:single-stranded-DNA-specific exonuclease RecJ [Pseudalkalibacillus caeni]TLS39277.1 single-stranded-DNA-specific exonuclease RecJ [Pseudalkalibacillus caeni]
MLQPKTRWNVVETDLEASKRLQSELGVSSIAATLLVNRGITSVKEAERFLYKKDLSFHDPFLMDGMEEAVHRIHRAIENNEKILIYGDYDADGVSSTSVMVYTLKELNATFDYYIPNRFTEGYGPNEQAFRWAKEEGFSLIITVDTGISGVHEAEVAKELEIDLIITDHHEPPPVLPDAYATINPKKPGCTYPFKGLAGVGVAFKLSHALLGKAPYHLLEIAAMGTIADLVPLIDENRLIADEGIKSLGRSTKKGVKALLAQCGIEDQEINADHIGFAIGPRLNAAGRLDSAVPAVQLLTTEDADEAKYIAEEIDTMNKERKQLVNEMTKEAIEEVENFYPPGDNNRVLVIAKEGWNPGVIGIVASRLVERFYRPTIVLSIDNEKGTAKGSARSIEGFDMFENLSICRDILPHFGGHPMAAGMTLNVDDLDDLRERLNGLAKEKLTDNDLIPLTRVDLECKVEDVTLESIEELNMLAPFGVSNPKPVVLLKDVNMTQLKRIGSEANHLKIALGNQSWALDGVGFHFGYVFEEVTPQSKVSVIGELSINEWNGHRKPQIFVQDIAVDEWQLFDYRGIRDLKKRLEMIPKDKLSIVAFRENTIKKFDLQDWETNLIEINDDNRNTKTDLSNQYVLFLDLPYHEDQIKTFLGTGVPERAYVVFHHEEDHFFTTIPSRDHFKWYYAFLLKRKRFDLKQSEQLAKHKGWSKETIHFMSKVFLELEFVTIENGQVSVNPNVAKRDLTKSETYRRKQDQARLENDLCYSSYHTLKEWFDQIINCSTSIEEALK